MPEHKLQARNLVVVRAGDRSLHWQWLKGAQERNWDLHINYFGDRENPFPEHQSSATISFDKGPKFAGLHKLWSERRDLLTGYDYICFPDDDISATADQWNTFFDVVNRVQPAIAQPALDERSFFWYDVVLRRKHYLYRSVDFIETMMPAFQNRVLMKHADMFKETQIGWGLDYIWSKNCMRASELLIIVDAAPMLHTRRIGIGANYAGFSKDRTPHMAMDDLLNKYSTKAYIPQALSAVFPDGSVDKRKFIINRKQFLPRIYRKMIDFMQVEQIL